MGQTDLYVISTLINAFGGLQGGERYVIYKLDDEDTYENGR